MMGYLIRVVCPELERRNNRVAFGYTKFAGEDIVVIVARGERARELEIWYDSVGRA